MYYWLHDIQIQVSIRKEAIFLILKYIAISFLEVWIENVFKFLCFYAAQWGKNENI